MATDLNILSSNLNEAFSGKVVSLTEDLGELTLVVKASDMLGVFTRLRDDADLRFEELIDVCGIDYSTYGSELCEDGKYLPDAPREGARFAAVYHLLSIDPQHTFACARVRGRRRGSCSEFGYGNLAFRQLV